MSDEVYHEDVKTVSRDGVTVERELVCEEAGITGQFAVTSRRDDPVRVRVVDDLPEYFPIDDVAFEAESAPDSGDISTERVAATRVVADEPVRIRYGIVPSEPVAEVRWSAPTVERVEPVEAADAPREEATGGSVGPVSDLADLFEGESGTDAGNGTDEDTADGVDAGPVAEMPGETGDGVPGSFGARLDHLSARVEEFAAYAAAVEPLVDERGGGSQLLADIESDLAGLDRRLDAIRAEVETVREEREEREEAVTDLREGLDRVDEALDAAESDLQRLEGRADDHDDAIESVEGDVSGVESDLRALESRVEGFEEGLADLEETVGSVEDELATLSGTVESMSEEVARIHDEVETLHEFRKSLAQISDITE